ncbi:hypothetical protein ALI22I_43410 [Saccharothrix sp. ALI-22-I]|nr:hypothetical protein ALI22I_43410 [Saccharothrix sp. ALI-22-I]
MPDGGGEGEESLGDTDSDAVEFGGDVALVRDDQQSRPFGGQVGLVVADGHEHLPLVDLRVG